MTCDANRKALEEKIRLARAEMGESGPLHRNDLRRSIARMNRKIKEMERNASEIKRP